MLFMEAELCHFYYKLRERLQIWEQNAIVAAD